MANDDPYQGLQGVAECSFCRTENKDGRVEVIVRDRIARTYQQWMVTKVDLSPDNSAVLHIKTESPDTEVITNRSVSLVCTVHGDVTGHLEVEVTNQ